MKWAALVVALLAAFPAAQWLRKSPKATLAAAMAVGLLPIIDVHINLISYEDYRGDSRGLEVTALDLVVLVLALALPKSKRPASLRPLWAFYLAVCMASALAAQVPLFSAFSIWKVARAFFLAGVVARLAESPKLASAILRGLALGAVYQGLLALEQRYLFGYGRCVGALSHPNSLAMSVNFVFPVAFALLLAGQGGKLAVATVGAAAASVVLSLSRGAMMMFVLASAIVFCGSILRRATGRKAAVALASVVGAAALLARAWDTILSRFLNAPVSSEEARVRFEAAAALMLHDRPFGIGMNQFPLVLEGGGYADLLGIPPVDRDGIVHNVYWLTAAELGYVGIVSYALLLAVPLGIAAHAAVKYRRDIRGDVLLGIVAALVVTYLQGTAEWIARQTFMFYLFAIFAGLVPTLARQAAASERRAVSGP